MAGSIGSTAPAGTPAMTEGYGKALTLLASLFFVWSGITAIDNTLLPHPRNVFDRNYTQTTPIESVLFIACFFTSIPSAKPVAAKG